MINQVSPLLRNLRRPSSTCCIKFRPKKPEENSVNSHQTMPPRKKKTPKTLHKSIPSTPPSTSPNPSQLEPSPPTVADELPIDFDTEINPESKPSLIQENPADESTMTDIVPEIDPNDKPSTESVEAPGKSGKKKIIRVKKVVRKRIVKKLVPKGSILSKKLDDESLQKCSVLDISKSDDNVGKGEECVVSERMKRRRTEIFVGGLDRDAKEEDLRSVFGKAGEISEVRLMMDGQSGKNKGYAFLRYVEPSQAKKAVAEFAKVEVCGKVCGAAAVQGNDTIFLGNIDKRWKKEDLIKLLTELEIENIDTVTVMMDPNNTDSNRGFAFIELETNRDAQRAYKKLQKKDVFGNGRNIKVAWADSFNIPDEEELQKVKSVYAEGVPDSWDEDKLMESFIKFGEIERIVLGKNIKSAKRRDIAFINYKTRKDALLCIESFSSEELTDNGSKVNLKVALAKRIQKVNQNKGGQKSFINNPLQCLASQDYSPALVGAKRAFSTLGNEMLYSDLRGLPRTHLDNSFGVAGPSYPMMPHGVVGSSLLHYPHQPLLADYSAGSFYQSGSQADTYQATQGVSPYTTSSLYHRYQM